MNKTLLSGAIASVLSLASLPSHALTLTWGGQNTNVTGGDQSGLTSNFVPLSNMISPLSGYFIETFDRATYNPLPAAPTYSGIFGFGTSGTMAATPLNGPGNADIRITQNQGCSINAWGGPILSVTGGGFAVQSGNTGSGANPAGDSTCYGFGPQPSGGTPATVRVDYAPILSPGARVDYLGVYYGSIDTYNNIAFYSSGNNLLVGTGLLADGVLTGQEILDAMNFGQGTGNQTAAGSNVYVNLQFAANEAFSAFEFRTTGVAFEFDNVVVHLTSTNIPEPGSLALAGLGLLGLGALRRRKQVQN